MRPWQWGSIALTASVGAMTSCQAPALGPAASESFDSTGGHVQPAGPRVEEVRAQRDLGPPGPGEARLEILVRFPPHAPRTVQVVPLGSTQVVVTLAGGPLTAPVVATVTPPPDADQLGARVFSNLQQGAGYTLEAVARNANGATLARSFQSGLSLLSGANSVGLTMNLTGTAGQVAF